MYADKVMVKEFFYKKLENNNPRLIQCKKCNRKFKSEDPVVSKVTGKLIARYHRSCAKTLNII